MVLSVFFLGKTFWWKNIYWSCGRCGSEIRFGNNSHSLCKLRIVLKSVTQTSFTFVYVLRSSFNISLGEGGIEI